MKIRLVITITFLMVLSSLGYAQDCMRLVRGTIKTLDNQSLSHIVVSADYGDTFFLNEGGYFELRVSSKCHSLAFKADGYLPETKEVDGSYLMVRLMPKNTSEKKNESDLAQTEETAKEPVPIQKTEELKKEEQKKIPHRIKSCYDEIQDLRDRISKSKSAEDIKEIYPHAGALSRKVHDYGDADLKLELNQLLDLLKQKSESLNQK